MARPSGPYQPKETRIRRVSEVSLGFPKKIAQDEARRCPQCAVATCLSGCPLGIDIPGFIRFLREGDLAASLEKIKKENPFPAVCGRICPAPCEGACVFHADGSPIAIRSLERFVSDANALKPEKMLAPAGAPKVAVIGSGPAGMTAAYFLAKSRNAVTIFEAAHEPGGLLRYGVPEFRLPQKVLDEQFAQLKLLGTEIVTDVIFGRTLMLDELFMRGFSAVLLSTGASLPQLNGLAGSSLAGVYYDVEFLSRLQSVSKEGALEAAREQNLPAGKSVVLGGGKAAFDAARLCLRAGSPTQIIFEGFEEQAGVDADMLEESKDEGLEMKSMQVLGLEGDSEGFVAGVKCRKLDIIEDGKGIRLEPSADEPVIIEAQTVVIANDHHSDGFLKSHLPQLKWNEEGFLWTDAKTGMTSMEKIFACGSVAGNAVSVVESMASGKKAAAQINQYLQG